MSTPSSSSAPYVPKWVKVGESSGTQMKVVTYNVLDDGESACMSKMHDYCPAPLRVWNKSFTYKIKEGETEAVTVSASGEDRLTRTVKHLQNLNADILSLQEVPPSLFQDFVNSPFGANYTGYHVSEVMERHGTGKINKPNNLDNCIFIKKSLLESSVKVVKATGLLFKDFLEEGRHTGKIKKRLSTLEENALVMQLLVGQTPVIISCTHLFWDPKYASSKTAQGEILARLHRIQGESLAQSLQAKPEAVSHICTGDFNSLPFYQPAFGLPSDIERLITLGSKEELKEILTADSSSILDSNADTTPTLETLSSYEVPADGSGVSEEVVSEAGKVLQGHVRSGVYHLFSRGSVPPNHPEHPDGFQKALPDPKQKKQPPGMGPLSAGAPWRHTYSSLPLEQAKQVKFSTRIPTFGGVLDWVWYRGNNVTVSEVLELPEQDSEGVYYPNAVHTSDHLAVGAVFNIK